MIIIFIILVLFFGIMTFFCFRGVDWVMLNGMIFKADRDKYRQKHDMIAMNRFIGKRIFLPNTILLLTLLPMLFDWPEGHIMTTIVPMLFFIVAIIVIVSTFFAIPKIFGTHFEK